MTDSPKSEAAEPKPSGLIVSDPRNAPVIFFEGAPNFGANSGVISVTLAFGRQLSGPSGIEVDVVASAHLRCSIPAAQGLISALQDALLLAQKTSGAAH